MGISAAAFACLAAPGSAFHVGPRTSCLTGSPALTAEALYTLARPILRRERAADSIAIVAAKLAKPDPVEDQWQMSLPIA
jgi:hypothetical protein